MIQVIPIPKQKKWLWKKGEVATELEQRGQTTFL